MAKEGVDDWYKVPSFDAGEAPRRSTSSLGASEVLRVDRDVVEQQIREAFRGVTLGGGVSLCQAQVADRYGEGFTAEQLSVLVHPEITDDWSRVPFSDLDSDCIAHLDAEGLRYYLAPLMLSVLERYERGSMRVIGTIGALDPRDAYNGSRFKLFNEAQRRAVAAFLGALPQLVALWAEDAKLVARSLNTYWGQYATGSRDGP